MSKELGKIAAKQVSEKTGKKVQFICFENGVWEFSLERRKDYKMIDIDSNVTQESKIHDNLLKPYCEPVYFQINCKNIENLEYFVENGYIYSG